MHKWMFEPLATKNQGKKTKPRNLWKEINFTVAFEKEFNGPTKQPPREHRFKLFRHRHPPQMKISSPTTPLSPPSVSLPHCQKPPRRSSFVSLARSSTSLLTKLLCKTPPAERQVYCHVNIRLRRDTIVVGKGHDRHQSPRRTIFSFCVTVSPRVSISQKKSMVETHFP